MASTFTSNLELEQQGAGDNAGTWGDTILNQNVMGRVDSALGDVTTVALASTAAVTLTLAQWRGATIKFTGTITTNITVSFPMNPTASAAVGGVRVIDNQCTGSFTVTVKTANGGSTGVVVPQAVRSVVVSDKTNVEFADDRVASAALLRIPTNAGTPVGVVTGIAGTAFKPGSLVLDRTNGIVYFNKTDGSSDWVPINGYMPFPQGYLTPTAGTPVIASDSTAATSLFYTPYVGNAVPVYNGAWMQAYFFSEMTLTLVASHVASAIYDVFAFLDAGTLRIGTGPAWTVATAGSGARGTGAGTTQLSRVNGLNVNTVSITARNGSSTYSVAASQATYLGSIFMDSSAGQITCHRSFGQSRKWGIWNAYNRQNIISVAGDATATWSYTTGTVRASNNDSNNKVTSFSGLAEEIVNSRFMQAIRVNGTAATAVDGWIGIGINSTTAESVRGFGGTSTNTGSLAGQYTPMCEFISAPALGINNIQCLERGDNLGDFYGGSTQMRMHVSYQG